MFLMNIMNFPRLHDCPQTGLSGDRVGNRFTSSVFLSPYFHHQHTEHFMWMGNVIDCLLLASAVHTHKHFGEESRFLS